MLQKKPSLKQKLRLDKPRQMLKHELKRPPKLQSWLKLKHEGKHKKRQIDRLSMMRLQEFRQSRQQSHRLSQNKPFRMP